MGKKNETKPLVRKRAGTDTPEALAISPAKAGVVLDLSLSTIKRRMDDGTIPFVRIGDQRRIPMDAIRALLAGQPDTK